MRQPFILIPLLTLGSLSALAQQPKVAAVMNNFSYILPFSPNYAIAQGSIFDIFGTNLATSASGTQQLPLPTTVNGTSVSITSSGTTTQAILYYVSPTQITAILPSATPFGVGALTVNNNGLTNSQPYSISIAPTEFGTLSLDGSGYGPAAAFDVNSNLLSPVNSANPGDVITLWGTGLGPVTGDETVLQTPQDLTKLPIEVDIGGIAATVQYHGRSIYPGVDQINVAIPAKVTPGCWVSVAVLTGPWVSNFTTIPIAASGGQTCSDTNTGISGDQLQTLYSQGAFNFAALAIGVENTPPMSVFGINFGARTYNNAQATFTRYAAASPFNVQMVAPRVIDGTAGTTSFAMVSLGSCVVNPQGGVAGAGATAPLQVLNAGPSIGVFGPGESTEIDPDKSGYYGSPDDVGNSLPGGFIPDDGGAFAFVVGSSGSDVGGFGVQAVVPGTFVWNEIGSHFVSRSSGMTVTWSGGDPTGFVQISGMSSADYGSVNLNTYFTCSAPAAAGTFTVPPSVTLSLPSTAVLDGIVSASYLSVTNYTNPVPFTAPGIDLGIVYGYVTATTSDLGTLQYQ